MRKTGSGSASAARKTVGVRKEMCYTQRVCGTLMAGAVKTIVPQGHVMV